MGLGAILFIGFVLIALVVVLFSVITNPRDVDQEEEASVEKEARAQGQKRQWWHRR